MKYHLYCFDLDDTLVATFSHAVSVLYPKLADRLGLPAPSLDAVRRTWGGPLRESLRTLFPDRGEPDRLVEMLVQVHAEYPVPAQPRATDILGILRRHGRSVALFSAGDPAIVRQTLVCSLDMAPENLDNVYFLSDRREAKGDPGVLDRIRKAVMKRAGRDIDPCGVLVVGDDPRDWLLAIDGHAEFAAVTTGIHSQAEHIAAGVPEGCVSSTLAAALSAPVDHGIVAVIQDNRARFLLVREGRRDNPYFGNWSGPHGACQADDVLEEETVVRETCEECGLNVRPVRRLYVRPADTKVRTVAFWSAVRQDPNQDPRIICPREVSEVGWFSLEEIQSPDFPLYYGTRDFFSRYEELVLSPEVDVL